MSKDENEIRVGIDIGGTFTDFVLLDASKKKLVLHKSLTTPSDPSRGAMLGIEALLEKSNIELWRSSRWFTGPHWLPTRS